MKTAPAYLVIADRPGKPRILRVTQRWPMLEPGEAIVRIELELPDGILNHPIHTIELEGDEIAVAVITHDPVEAA